MASAVESAIEVFAELGAHLTDVTMPLAEDALNASLTLTRREAYLAHRDRLEKHSDAYGPDVHRRLLLGARTNTRQLAAAKSVRTEWRDQVGATFSQVDAVLGPTTPLTAPKIDVTETVSGITELGRFTYPWSLAGVPAMSIPGGFDGDGLPVGLQITAPARAERVLLDLGEYFQIATSWHERQPAGC